MESDEAKQQEELQSVLRAESEARIRSVERAADPSKADQVGGRRTCAGGDHHHIVSDGWSMEIIIREVSQLYEAFRQGQGSPLPELEIQYADYAMWQRWLQGEVLATQLQYWREKLDGVAALELPTDRRDLRWPTTKDQARG